MDEPETGQGGVFAHVGKIVLIYACCLLAALAVLMIVDELGSGGAAITSVLLAITLGSYVVIGVAAGTREHRQYFLAGRDIPAFANGMAAAAQWSAPVSLVALTGALYHSGYDSLAYGLGWIGGLVLAGVLIAPYVRRSGAATAAEFLAQRFGSPLVRALAMLIAATGLMALLVALMNGAGTALALSTGLSPQIGAAAAVATVLACALFGGVRGASLTQPAQLIVLLTALLAPLAILAALRHGVPVPQLAYGEVVQEISRLEIGMIEKGLADAVSMKPHAKPFLATDAVNVLALILSVMAGTAAMPHLLMRFSAARSAGEARLSAAWAAFFVLLVVSALPAVAAFAKLEVYALIDKGTPFAALPAWMEAGSRLDLIRIHGLSLKLVDDVARAVSSGATDTAGVAAELKARSADTLAAWSSLKESARSALLAAARRTAETADADRWQAFREVVLPAVAKAAGNKTGVLTHGALWVHPEAVLTSLPTMSGQPAVVTALLSAAILAVALSTMTGIALAIANSLALDGYVAGFDRHATPARRLAAARLLLVATAGGAGAASFWLPVDPALLASAGFSMLAGGLFPALALAVWWQRVNAWGAAAGMIAGSALCLYYLAGPQFWPSAFYETWAPLSDATPAAARKFSELKAAWISAEGEAKSAAAAALELHARGGPAKAGIANWLGIAGPSAAVFAVPFALLVTAAVSLITPRPGPQLASRLDALRRPTGDAPDCEGAGGVFPSTTS